MSSTLVSKLCLSTQSIDYNHVDCISTGWALLSLWLTTRQLFACRLVYLKVLTDHRWQPHNCTHTHSDILTDTYPSKEGSYSRPDLLNTTTLLSIQSSSSLIIQNLSIFYICAEHGRHCHTLQLQLNLSIKLSIYIHFDQSKVCSFIQVAQFILI